MVYRTKLEALLNATMIRASGEWLRVNVVQDEEESVFCDTDDGDCVVVPFSDIDAVMALTPVTWNEE